MSDCSRAMYLRIKSKFVIFIPVALILATPPIVILMWYINVFLGGSLEHFEQLASEKGFFPLLFEVWSPIFWGTSTSWNMIAFFICFQLVLMRIVPGAQFLGPVSPMGNVPIYKANGLQCFFITMLTFYLCAFELQLFSPTIIYDNFGALLSSLNIFSFSFCILLYLKGRYFPSSTDSCLTGNLIFDFYWGTELYPRLFGWDIKTFTNCRFGMMCWGLIILSFAAKQKELYGLSDSMFVSVALQLFYIAKFFYWETGYLKSLDIMHDKAGYYICWGCLVWVPGVYSSQALYLVNHPNHLGSFLSLVILISGAACIMANFLADRQRQRIRETKGHCKIWRKEPKTLSVQYRTESGEWKENILLLSGWWGISRHFHYVFEILAAFFWTVPALFTNFIPYFYLVFLTLLLIERAFRDDKRCADKYGTGWDNYCKHVPYKIIPYII